MVSKRKKPPAKSRRVRRAKDHRLDLVLERMATIQSTLLELVAAVHHEQVARNQIALRVLEIAKHVGVPLRPSAIEPAVRSQYTLG